MSPPLETRSEKLVDPNGFYPYYSFFVSFASPIDYYSFTFSFRRGGNEGELQRIAVFILRDLNDFFFFFFLHLIFNVKFIFNYTERACRSTKETVIIRMKRVLGFNGEEADARSIRRTILPSLDPIIPYGYVGKEEFLKEFFFNEKSFSLSSSFFSRQIDRVGYDDEGDARDTGGPLRPRSQPLLGGRRQSATCCTNIVQGHRASAARG